MKTSSSNVFILIWKLQFFIFISFDHMLSKWEMNCKYVQYNLFINMRIGIRQSLNFCHIL